MRYNDEVRHEQFNRVFFPQQPSSHRLCVRVSIQNLHGKHAKQGETTELCKWTVDLGNLPNFQQQASMAQGGFYTGKEAARVYRRCRHLAFVYRKLTRNDCRAELEFELGLELDSAEVRGILMYEGQEWGRVVFDFLA